IPDKIVVGNGLLNKTYFKTGRVEYQVADEGKEENAYQTRQEMEIPDENSVAKAPDGTYPGSLHDGPHRQAHDQGQEHGCVHGTGTRGAEVDKSRLHQKENQQHQSRQGDDVAVGSGQLVAPSQGKTFLDKLDAHPKAKNITDEAD